MAGSFALAARAAYPAGAPLSLPKKAVGKKAQRGDTPSALPQGATGFEFCCGGISLAWRSKKPTLVPMRKALYCHARQVTPFPVDLVPQKKSSSSTPKWGGPL